MPLSTSTINTRIKNRTDTTSNWTTINPILEEGEIGFEITADSETKFKVGDGTSRWNLLNYVVSPDEIQIGPTEPTKYKLWINPSATSDDEIQISNTEPIQYKVWINPEGTNDGALTIYTEFLFRLDQNQQIVNFNNISYNDIMFEFQRNSHIVATIVGAINSQKTIFPLIRHIDSFIFGNVVNNAFYTIEINNNNNISFNQIPLGKNYTGGNGIEINNTTNVIRTDFGDSTMISASLFTLDFTNPSNSIMPSELWNFSGNSEEFETEDENTYNYMSSQLRIVGHYFDPNASTTTIKIYDNNNQIIHNISINELTLLEGLANGEDVYLYDPVGFVNATMLDDDSAFDLTNWANVFGFAFWRSNDDGQDIDDYIFVASDVFLNNCIKLEMLQDKNGYKTIDSNAIKLSKNFIKKDDGTIDLAFGTLKKIQDISDLKYYISDSASANNTLINNLYCFSLGNNSYEGISAINSEQNFYFKNALDDKCPLHFFRFDEGDIKEYNINNLYPTSDISSDYYRYLLIKYKNSYLECKELPQGNPLYTIFNNFGIIDYNDNFIFFGCGYNTNTTYDTIINTSTIESIDPEEQSFYFIIIFKRSNKTYCPLFLTTNSTLDIDDFAIIHQKKLYHTLSFNALCQDGATRKTEASFFAIGNNSIADDEGAVAIGDSVETTGEYSVTFGQKNKNEGQKSIILNGTGNYINSGSNNSLVGGYNNKINGSVYNSIILGRDNNISNYNSTPIMLFGQSLQDSSSMYPCLTIGQYNVSSSNALFIVGNGYSNDTRNNLLELGNLLSYNNKNYSAILNGAGLYIQGDLTIYGGAYYKANDTYYPYINTSLFQNLQPLSSSATLAEAIAAYNNLLAILKGE